MVRAHLFRVAEVLLPSLGAAAFCSMGFRATGAPAPLFWVALTGILTFAVYLFYYSWPWNGAKLTFTPKARWGVGLSAIGLLVGACMLWQYPLVGLWYMVSSCLPLLYLSPKLPLQMGRFSEPLLAHKPLFLALVWIWGAFLLPFMSAGYPWQSVPWRGLWPYGVILFGLCLFFSWRDRERDLQAWWLKRAWQAPRLTIALLGVGFAISVWQSPVFPLMALVQAGIMLTSCLLTRTQARLVYVLADASMLCWWW